MLIEHLFPNPCSTGVLSIKLKENVNNAAFHIVDNIGTLLKSGILLNSNNLIDVSDLANGIYFFKINSGFLSEIITLQIAMN